MNKYILFFIYLFSTSISTYRPFSKKTLDFDDGNLCHQKESTGDIDIEYVQNCPQNYYCDSTDSSSGNELYTCQPYNKTAIGFNEICEDNTQCLPGLTCENVGSQKKCAYTSTGSYSVTEPVNSLSKKFCLDNKYYYSSTDELSGCRDLPNDISKETYDSYSQYTKDNKVYNFEPGFCKVEGEIHFKPRAANQPYEIESIETALIGSVATGKFVSNDLACQSGFALPYYGNGKITNDGDSTLGSPEFFCVDILEVEKTSTYCAIKYNDGSKEKIYHTNSASDCNYLMIKLEIFKNYSEQLKTLYTECEEKKTYEEPYTCRNDELRKWWYFYRHPDQYILYKDKREIRSYLLQKQYPSYSTDLTDGSGFLNIKYFILLLILISL